MWNMKRYSSLLVYISIAFLAYYLYRFDYIELGGIRPSYPRLVVSVIFLCLAFMADALAWWKTLSIHDVSVPAGIGVASHGLAIFTKYIPGKVWVILGRAAYVSKHGFPLVKTSLVSIKAQIIAIWVGLILGLLPVLILQRFTKLNILSIVILFLATAFILSPALHNGILRLIYRLTKKKIEIPVINPGQLSRISLYYIMWWGFLMIGFFFMASSFLPGVSLTVSFAFPLAATLGILAIVFPGGLGVREGILVGYLVFVGIPVKEATTICILARLWFVIGELFIFSTAFILDRKHQRGASRRAMR